MKIILAILLLVVVSLAGQSQGNPDSTRVTRLISASWFPSGKSILFRLMSFDESRKTPPKSATFTYRLSDGKIEKLPVSGTYVAVSPDETKLVFTRVGKNNKHDIYLFDFAVQKERTLVSDTFHKSVPQWSPDGKSIVYNMSHKGTGRYSTIDVCVVDISSGVSKIITNSNGHKSYNPVWAPKGNNIAYYFEKGDNRDQIFLTDNEGKQHRNLTNDTSTHNYFPSWIESETIVFTRAPDLIVTMKINGSELKVIEGVNSFLFQFNPRVRKGLFISQSETPELMIYDWDTKTKTFLLDKKKISSLKVEG